MTRRYRKPPILEATFEARFETSPTYNIRTPPRLFDELEPDYPADPVLMSGQGLEVLEGASEGLETTFRLKKESFRYQLESPDSSWRVRFNRRMLSVHSTAPYPGWDTFRSRIDRALSAYILVAQPTSLRRTSIRYINQINFDEAPVDLAAYFTTAPDTPQDSPAHIGAFFQRLEYFWPGQPLRLVQTFASSPGEKLGVILDLDMIDESLVKIKDSSPSFLIQIDKLRQAQREVFESLITDKLREMFDAE